MSGSRVWGVEDNKGGGTEWMSFDAVEVEIIEKEVRLHADG